MDYSLFYITRPPLAKVTEARVKTSLNPALTAYTNVKLGAPLFGPSRSCSGHNPYEKVLWPGTPPRAVANQWSGMRERGNPRERAATMTLKRAAPSFSFIVLPFHDDKTFFLDNIMILIPMSF